MLRCYTCILGAVVVCAHDGEKQLLKVLIEVLWHGFSATVARDR